MTRQIRARQLMALLAALVVSASSCGTGLTTQARPGQRPRTGGPDTSTSPSGSPTNLDPALGLLVGKPVYDGDFADPYVLVDGGRYYAYATNTQGANLPVIVSDGSQNGQYFGDAFPKVPSWSTPGFVWAPAVYASNGGYVLFYATYVNATKRQCLSRAVARSPLGPFVDDSTAPFVCQTDLGGTIDPSVVTAADGMTWLLFKNDGNCCNITTSLWIQQLSSDGLGVVGSPTKLLSADQPWEGGLIEAPSMVIDGNTYFLFFSANAWDTADYAIGYATCTSITGPCSKPERSPWMSSTALARGPGGQEYYSAAGQVWMVYHGWAPGEVGYDKGGERRLYLDSLRIIDGRPVRVGAEQAAAVLVIIVSAGAVVVGLGVGAFVFVRRHRRRRIALTRASGHRPSN